MNAPAFARTESDSDPAQIRGSSSRESDLGLGPGPTEWDPAAEKKRVGLGPGSESDLVGYDSIRVPPELRRGDHWESLATMKGGVIVLAEEKPPPPNHYESQKL